MQKRVHLDQLNWFQVSLKLGSHYTHAARVVLQKSIAEPASFTRPRGTARGAPGCSVPISRVHGWHFMHLCTPAGSRNRAQWRNEYTCDQIYLDASLRAPRSLSVVCLTSSKLFCFGPQVCKLSNRKQVYETIVHLLLDDCPIYGSFSVLFVIVSPWRGHSLFICTTLFTLYFHFAANWRK